MDGYEESPGIVIFAFCFLLAFLVGAIHLLIATLSPLVLKFLGIALVAFPFCYPEKHKWVPCLIRTPFPIVMGIALVWGGFLKGVT